MNPNIQHIQKQLATLFEKYKDKIIFVYLFGSVVKGNISNLSDIDLAFHAKPAQEMSDLKLALYADSCRLLRRNDIDIVILNELKNLILADEIITNGIVIYDSEPDRRISYEVRVHHHAIDFKHQRKMLMGI